MGSALEALAGRYEDCVTPTCREPNCNLILEGIGESVIIDGNKYQEQYGYADNLCDRLIFCRYDGPMVAAVELKGGRNPELPKAIDQIQGGLTLARAMLTGAGFDLRDWRWLPLLLSRGGSHPNDLRVARAKAVYFRGREEAGRVVLERCGAALKTILDRQG